MSLPLKPETSSTSTAFQEPVDALDAAMEPFTPGQCLFCPCLSPSFADSMVHMQKSHGLFVPDQEHLVVDLETFFTYLHLVIFGYRECIRCGTERVTVQAVQQHMTGKGHCTFDASRPDSEFAEFFDFSEEPESDDADSAAEDIEGGGSNLEKAAASASRKPLLIDDDSIRLPSGKIISRRSAAQAGPSLTQSRRQTRATTVAPRFENTPADGENVVEKEEEALTVFRNGEEGGHPGMSDMRLLSKREKRERTAASYQLASMSAGDRNALVHLSAPQQRALLATQLRQAEKVQKVEKRRQSRIDRKGNKNLYAYWHTETPVYQCG
ncbi:tri15-like protein [Niveomyces insectorum RCEF 264]|uniref:Tri15-like protein n=1 Tax=Niveomyces insectorum RCEF 264 TaxID=1081102 RepID=A0A167XWN8_9HYPO|nr:tri15-like protein [Niveomyces insectorum RCEF 264]